MSARPNSTAFTILNLSITTPGTAEQMAQNFVPDGLDVVVTARRTNSGSMYVARTQAAAQSGSRVVFIPGQSVTFSIDSTDRLWFDADSDSDILEVRIPVLN